MKKLLILILIIVAILLAIRANAGSLDNALVKYQTIAGNGGWNKVISNSKIKLGDCDSRTISLWSRLFISGDTTDDFHGYFDSTLEDAVKRFQIRHGIKPDGIVGKETLQELNVPVEERIKQIKSNINKVELKNGFIVNIPDFKLYIVENESITRSFRVIVGKKKNPTPLLSAKIRYVEMNPYWNVPHSIAVKELLPIIKKNPKYLEEDNFRVFESWAEGAKEIKEIDWNGVTKYNFRYKLRQDPGKNNVLGAVKFIFPNPHSVYMHDTDKKYLFEKDVRAFSHGCVRVDDSMTLALHVLINNVSSEINMVVDLTAEGSRKFIKLLNPIDIHIVYWTAWIDDNGINFRKDIYGLNYEETGFAWD